MWHKAIRDAAGAAGDRRTDDLPAGDHPDVRAARVGAGRDTARGRRIHPRLRLSSRSPPACGAARLRWSPATSRTRPTVYAQLTQLLREKHGQQIYSEDGSHVDDQVARLLAGRRIATAESCTAGLLAARLTDRPGSSDYVMGGVGQLLQRGEGAAARCRPGADRGARRGVRTGGRGDGGGRFASASAPTPRSRSPESPARVGERRKSRSARSVSP